MKFRVVEPPTSKRVGTVPADKQSILKILGGIFQNEGDLLITHVGFLDHVPGGRIYFQNYVYGTIGLENPIAGVEGLADEMIRLALELKYKRVGQSRGSIQMWDIRKATLHDKPVIVAYAEWAARSPAKT